MLNSNVDLSFSVMARPLKALDWVVIAALVILAAIVLWLLKELVIIIAIIAVGYIIYRWYTGRRLVRMG
jgi:Flp pilus assembly protein TadB